MSHLGVDLCLGGNTCDREYVQWEAQGGELLQGACACMEVEQGVEESDVAICAKRSFILVKAVSLKAHAMSDQWLRKMDGTRKAKGLARFAKDPEWSLCSGSLVSR